MQDSGCPPGGIRPDLLDTLIRYILPAVSKKAKQSRQSGLEGLLEKPRELVFLEGLVSSFLEGKMPLKSNTEKIEFGTFAKSVAGKNESEISIAFQRKKESSRENCTIEIQYAESKTEEKLGIKIKSDAPSSHYSAIQLKEKNENKEYSLNLTRKKEGKTKDNYSVSIVYESDYQGERLSISYKSTIGTYLNKRQQALHDFTDRVPGKHVNVFPESVMGGVLGFTYLGENFMGLRDDLTGNLKKMVDIHESIHTPDEYETRILTDWIMAKSGTKYIK